MGRKALIFLLALVCFQGCLGSELRIVNSFPGDALMWQRIFGLQEKLVFDDEPVGVIVPHHIMVADTMNAFYAGMAEKIQPKTVVIIGPNHYQNEPQKLAQTCYRCVYDTPDGDLEVDVELVKKLSGEGVAEIWDQSFGIEHAIFAHAPFVKHYFPDARIVPLILQWKIPLEDADNLAKWLDDNLPQDALVLASVDFSHYLPEAMADFHDLSSQASIQNFDFANIYDLEVDSPSSIYTIMKYAVLRDALKAERLAHTNTQDFMKAVQERSTSHQFWAFTAGEPQRIRGVGIMTYLGLNYAENDWEILDSWPDGVQLTGELEEMRGEEDRFFMGADFHIFNLKDGSCEMRQQNEMRLKFCRQGKQIEYLVEGSDLSFTFQLDDPLKRIFGLWIDGDRKLNILQNL